MKEAFGDRMKAYENVSQINLMRKTPVIIRIDGKAFHTYTRGLVKPFDKDLSDAMARTTLLLCKNIQGACFGYTQSDEISILLQDWKSIDTDCWYGNNLQKIVSVSASLATAIFNRNFTGRDSYALFDSRAYNIPYHEVVNYFIWRANDCTRNSLSSLAQSKFSHKQLQGKNGSEMQEMLWVAHNINWNNTETRYKRGICVVPDGNGSFTTDFEPPIFTQNRDYIERNFKFEEDNESSI